MTTPGPWEADAVTIVLGWLRQHAASVGLPGDGHVTGVFEAPWPHVLVEQGAGGDPRDLRWETVQDVSIEVIGDPAGTVGQAALWSTAMQVAAKVTELGEAPHVEGAPVVAAVYPSGLPSWVPLETGQGRYLFTASLLVHP